MQNFETKKISSSLLIDRLKTLVQSERKITAEIIDVIREIDVRKLYLNSGHTSLFAFLTAEMGYSPGAAQRRIDTARMTRDIPEIKAALRSGNLNLTQVSKLAHCVRQKQREEPGVSVSAQEKRELLQQVQNLVEMSQNDELPLLEASRICNRDITHRVQQVICFAFHDSNLLLETCVEARAEMKIVTLFYLD